ncbi:MAG TPA: hypothetical protein VGD67_03070 [Pseudonocardiaceae bacterium]
MLRAVQRVGAISSLVAILVVTGYSTATAQGAMGLNGPTGEPLPWTLAGFLGIAGAAFLVRAVLKLRRRKA